MGFLMSLVRSEFLAHPSRQVAVCSLFFLLPQSHHFVTGGQAVRTHSHCSVAKRGTLASKRPYGGGEQGEKRRLRAGPARLDVRHSLVVCTSGSRTVMELSAAEFPESSPADWTSGIVHLDPRESGRDEIVACI